ncbi:MAG: hypothetical protein WD696_23550 [Bryobacteraceae bacterium]
MTKVQMHFGLDRPLDETLLTRIADAHSIYGFVRLRLDDRGDGLTVDYDASRLTPADVEAALRRAGIPIVLKQIK